jgi:hypothetical protein
LKWLLLLRFRLPLSVLLQVHVSILIASFVFIGFSQIALASSESDPRKNLKSYISHVDARRLLAGATVVGAGASLGAIVTLVLALLPIIYVVVISAILAMFELFGLTLLLWRTFLALKRY